MKRNESSDELNCEGIQLTYRSTTKKWAAASFILTANLFEYTCFYGISGILLEYLVETYNWENFNAFVVDSLFLTLYLLLAIVGGLLADFLFHRILLICITYLCYLFGILGLVILKLNSEKKLHKNIPTLCGTDSPQNNEIGAVHANHTNHTSLTEEPCYYQILLLVILVCLGSGVSRVILSVIGADQVRSSGPQSVSIFFFMNYMSSQIGIIIVNVTLHKFGRNERVNYLIFLGCMLIASALVLICGRPFYEMHKNLGSINHLFKILSGMWKNYKDRGSTDSTQLNASLIDLSKTSLGGSVDDHIVDGFKRLIPVLLMFVLILPFSMLQRTVKLMDVQSKHMNIPTIITFESSIYSFESLMIVLCIPIVIVIILTRTNSQSILSTARRIGVGSLCGLMAVLSSGLLETVRLNRFWGYNSSTLTPGVHSLIQTVDNETYLAADMSAFWMSIPYALMAISESLVIITALEYVYLTCPPWLQCTGIGFIFGSWGLGSLMDDPLSFNLDGVIFNLMHINQRKPYPCQYKSFLTSHINSVVCWGSRLDYIYYIIGLAVSGLTILIVIFIRIFCPELFQMSFMGLETRLLGKNEDVSDEDEYEE